MFGLVKKAFAVIATFFNLSHVNYLECVSINDQKCKARPKITDVNNNEPAFFPLSIKVKKCGGSVIISMIHMLNCLSPKLLKK